MIHLLIHPPPYNCLEHNELHATSSTVDILKECVNDVMFVFLIDDDLISLYLQLVYRMNSSFVSIKKNSDRILLQQCLIWSLSDGVFHLVILSKYLHPLQQFNASYSNCWLTAESTNVIKGPSEKSIYQRKLSNIWKRKCRMSTSCTRPRKAKEWKDM